MGSFKCDGTLFKMPRSIQLVTRKYIIQGSKMQMQKNEGVTGN